jgi:polyisoprenoid-binding protein YceI
MNRKFSFIIGILLVLLWLNPALAKTESWDIDKIHSNIYFDIRHIYATVRGFFGDFSGSIIHDTENPENSRVEFEVNVDSINTNIPKRDEHLRSDAFFAAKTYPKMTFKSTHVKKIEGNRYLMEGDLTIKGTTRKIAVPFTYYGMRENPMQKGTMVAGLEAEFTIDRLDYGVGDGKFFKMGAIGKDVHIVVTLEVLKPMDK